MPFPQSPYASQGEAIKSQIPSYDLSSQYVASGLDMLLTQAIAALPRYADDLQQEHGDELYDRMMKDPAVWSVVQMIIETVLQRKVRVEASIEDQLSDDYELANELARFAEYNLNNTARPLVQILSEMLNAFIYGCCVGEKVGDLKITAKYGLKMCLTNIVPLARKNYLFVTDRYGNVVGFVIREPGRSVPSGYVDPQYVLDRDKFAVLSFGVVAGDPRGRSQIRPAYNPWWFKLQTYPRWLKYLQQFSTPSLIIFTPADDGDDSFVELKDANGNPVIRADGTTVTMTKEQLALEAGLKFQAGSVMALKGGSQVELVQSDGEGQAFINTIDALNREIMLAIVGNARANLEAKNSSKADSESANDNISRKIDWVQAHVEQMLQRDVVEWLIRMNYPADVADRLMPKVCLVSTDKEDVASLMSAVATLYSSDYLDDSQIEGTDSMLNLPKRDMVAWLQRRQEQRDMSRQAHEVAMQVGNPTRGYNGDQ